MIDLTGVETLEELRHLKKGASVESLRISREALTRLIMRFQAADINSEEISTWAELLDLADEVVYEDGYEDVIGQVLFVLSTPELHNPLSKTQCTELLGTLQDRSR